MKKIAIVPTLLTLGNGVCGFAAIACASKIGGDSPGQDDFFFAAAGWLIVAAMVFDMLDGYVARLSKTASKFGGELDSLCDAISFGVAPAFLLLKMGPGWEPRPILHQLLAGIATLYMVCAILRLARFNVENTPDAASHKRFRGLPSPAAAGCLASLAILRGELPGKLVQYWPDVEPEVVRQMVQRLVETLAPLGALVVALLMVSLVSYPHVTKQVLRGRRQLGHLVQVLIASLIIVLVRELALALLFWIYSLGVPLRYMLVQSLRREEMPAPRLHDGMPH
ncbi:MAG: CDP-diacylglycerol--serine O-phosphatidyltransferase [Planctomycetes bacterium]|nr:CDP-diacylglycerol--serine O-phosphatidyltransferase [Planctomycetota bacterium]